MLLALMLPAACAHQPAEPVPWAYQATEGQHQQIMREKQVASDIRLGGLEFSGPEQAQAVNAALTEMQERTLAQGTAAAEQYLADREFNGTLQEGQLYYFTLTEDMWVFYNDGLILSVIVDGYRHMNGEPHPNTYRHAYTFDAASGKMLALEDIWGADARERVADAIYTQVEQEGRLAEFFPNLQENLLHGWYAYNWYMDAENLYIIYNPYEIAAYAAGIIEFKLPRQ